MNNFMNKVVVITGAGSGIGRALSLEFAKAGSRLALSDLNEAGLNETLDLLPDNIEARGYKLDVSSREAVLGHANDVVRDFGTAHVIINNAGAAMFGTVANTSIEEYEWQLNINMYGVLYGTKAFLPIFRRQNEGWIVNISSIFGLISVPAYSAYNMSKFAVRGLTECLWSELQGTGVQAVSVHPGGIKTNIDKTGRCCADAGTDEKRVADDLGNVLRTPPEQCAADIVNGLKSGKRRILTGHLSSTVFWLSRLLPNSYPKILKLFAK